MPSRSLVRTVWLCVALLACACLSHAQSERIVDFHSDITLQEDSSLLVTETITVIATGNQIRHGIYRDFPTRYKDPLGNNHVVGFQMLSATCDSADEVFRVQEDLNGKRMYLGDPNTFVSRGQHSYTLTYTTNRQLGFYKDHDELFWNVTGNGWIFPIDQASATVHLISAILPDRVTLSGFTGPQGSREAALASSTDDNAFNFTTTRTLHSREGLSVLLMWPKGYITPPTFFQEMEYFFRDNRDSLPLAVGLVVLLLYYLLAWSAVGRDPTRGVIMPQYEPPANLSPAAMRYLVRMGFDNKTFAASILDMAARGYLKITNQAGSYTLYTTGKDDRVLTPDEKQVAAELFNGRNQIWLHNENHAVIRAALTTMQKWLKTAELKVYFVTNSKYVILPIILSIALVIGYLVAQGGPKIAMGVFLCFWLSLWTMGVASLAIAAVKGWRSVVRSGPSAGGIGKALFITLFGLPFVGFEIMALFFLMKVTSISLLIFLVAAGIVHAVFAHLLKAPTAAGRRLIDQVEGFKLFLGRVDGDRLNRVMPPEQTPETFEKFLPYALALDVEQAWAEKFSGVLAAAGNTPQNGAYTPSFYSGPSWNAFSNDNFASSFTNSFTDAISSSSTPPGSSSGGGGGGGSGGGGGGGGGGGW